MGAKLVYDGEKKRSLQVTPEIFSTFAKVKKSGWFRKRVFHQVAGNIKHQQSFISFVTLVLVFFVFFLSNQEHPFLNKTWGSCAVVGNGGILSNSSCGKTIDSAQFVIR